ncbi:uncharacterized protein LOC132031671 [Lycium ferocissimum]|uniref:uncharacterized protein LOC132031671 n=1 Tax=Lycium ferocissimum TaxID=112874 RepID=UPI002815D268|nr:uncharacterized protein LOC132031671 [Lycium ferocissimum]
MMNDRNEIPNNGFNNGDVSGIQLISFQLTGIENYPIWFSPKNLLGGIMYVRNAQLVCDDPAERLKDLWEEFEALVPSPSCECPRSRDFVLYLQKLKLCQFLMGLNQTYSKAGRQIRLRNPLPTVNQLCTLKIRLGKERLKDSRKNDNLVCEVCKRKGHSKESCYKVVGYPSDFKFQRKGTGNNAAYNVNLMQENVVGAANNGPVSQFGQFSQQFGKQCQPQFSYAHNTNICTQNTYSKVETDSPTLEQRLKHYTGATNHMVSDIKLLNKDSVVKITNPKKVCLPNGDVTQVTHPGKYSISDRNTVSDDLFTRKVREIGKEEDGLYLLMSHANHKTLNTSMDARANEKLDVCVSLKHFFNFVHNSSENYVYTPQQNGVAKRKYRHMLKITRAIRFQGKIPIKFWGHCVLAAIYLINRLSSTDINNMSPCEELHNKKPNLNHLKVLGYLCFAKIV